MKICRNLSIFLQNHCPVGDFDDFLRLRACQSSAGVKYVAFRRRPADGCWLLLAVLFQHKDAGFALAHLEGDFSGAFRPGEAGEDFTRGASADEADGLQAVSVRMDADEAASSVDAVV